nr:MAG TPA: hypothetical protein [Bacteriophage sp.]
MLFLRPKVVLFPNILFLSVNFAYLSIQLSTFFRIFASISI